MYCCVPLTSCCLLQHTYTTQYYSTSSCCPQTAPCRTCERTGKHRVWTRVVRTREGGSMKQAFTQPCTPSDVRSGRQQAAKLRRLDRAV